MCAVVMQQSAEAIRPTWSHIIGENPAKIEDAFFRHAHLLLGDMFDFFEELDVYLVQGMLHMTLLTCGTN
jgi:hypothetical protein